MVTPSPNDISQSHLEAILSNAVDAIVTISAEGIVRSVNPATERMFGYTANEVVGQNVKLLMPSPYREEHDSYVSNYLKSGEKKIIGIGREVTGRRRDGTTFPIHLAVSEINVEGLQFFTGVMRDLSALKRAEAEQTSMGRILEDSLNELYFFDAETHKFIQVNRGARENIGYTMAELHQMTPVDIKPRLDHDDFVKLISPLQNGTTKRVVFETVHRRKNGSEYDVEVHLQMGWLQDRHVYVAIILDTTDRKAAERQLHKLNEELEERVEVRTAQLRVVQSELVQKEKMAMLGQVSGGIAHEIRNPLNAIKTSAYYLLNAKSPPKTKVTEHLERIDRQVTLIDNVITALSDVAKLPEPKLYPVDIDKLIRQIVNSATLPSTIITEIQLPADLPPVLADENQLPIVFLNLIRNARDAMPDGGKLTIHSHTMECRVCITVKDDGVGIPAEHLARVLEPFYSTKARGMGLGLAISRAIVQKNRGEIRISSQIGEGTSCEVCLEAASHESGKQPGNSSH
jgi:two-component system sensor kinase FixL